MTRWNLVIVKLRREDWPGAVQVLTDMVRLDKGEPFRTTVPVEERLFRRLQLVQCLIKASRKKDALDLCRRLVPRVLADLPADERRISAPLLKSCRTLGLTEQAAQLARRVDGK